MIFKYAKQRLISLPKNITTRMRGNEPLDSELLNMYIISFSGFSEGDLNTSIFI